MDSGEPHATRPYMPGYEGMFHDVPLVPWRWAEERLLRSHNYWLATTRPDGRPHVMPVWGIWLDRRFCFSTGANSRKARNLAANARCSVTTDDSHEAVIVEGHARTLDASRVERFLAIYGEKYDWPMEDFSEPLFEVVPHAAFAFIEGSATAPYNPTRWSFTDR